MVKFNLQASKERLSEEICTYINSIFAPPCLQICKGMQEKLPRELRDKVYAFTLDVPHTSIHEDNFEPIGKTPCSGPPRLYEADHLRNKQFAYPTTLHKLLRYWYISRDFRFDGNASVLAKLMDHDVWGHGLPVYDLVEKVTVIWWDDQSFVEESHEDESEDGLAKNRARDLESLFLLKPGAHINMVFETGVWPIHHGSAQGVVTIWSEIFPLLSRLVDAGYRVTADVIRGVKLDVIKDEINEETWIRKILEFAAELKKREALLQRQADRKRLEAHR